MFTHLYLKMWANIKNLYCHKMGKNSMLVRCEERKKKEEKKNRTKKRLSLSHSPSDNTFNINVGSILCQDMNGE